MISTQMIRRRAPGFGLALVLFLTSVTVPSRPARAGASEERMLSITKTTVYGALLGGLLGVASALVVKEGERDNAIRWGIALGAFAGCIYGVVDTARDPGDGLSIRRPDPVQPGGLDLVQGWRLGGPVPKSVGDSIRMFGPGGSSGVAEVLDGGLEEEEHGEEGRRCEAVGRGEAGL